MGDAVVDGLSDRGSTPLRSTQNGLCKNSGNTVFMRVSAVFLFLQKKSFQTVLDRFSSKKWGTNWGTKRG